MKPEYLLNNISNINNKHQHIRIINQYDKLPPSLNFIRIFKKEYKGKTNVNNELTIYDHNHNNYFDYLNKLSSSLIDNIICDKCANKYIKTLYYKLDDVSIKNYLNYGFQKCTLCCSSTKNFYLINKHLINLIKSNKQLFYNINNNKTNIINNIDNKPNNNINYNNINCDNNDNNFKNECEIKIIQNIIKYINIKPDLTTNINKMMYDNKILSMNGYKYNYLSNYINKILNICFNEEYNLITNIKYDQEVKPPTECRRCDIDQEVKPPTGGASLLDNNIFKYINNLDDGLNEKVLIFLIELIKHQNVLIPLSQLMPKQIYNIYKLSVENVYIQDYIISSKDYELINMNLKGNPTLSFIDMYINNKSLTEQDYNDIKNKCYKNKCFEFRNMNMAILIFNHKDIINIILNNLKVYKQFDINNVNISLDIINDRYISNETELIDDDTINYFIEHNEEVINLIHKNRVFMFH